MEDGKVLYELYDIINDRSLHPKEGSYTNYLLEQGLDKILKKIGEEATETIIAAKNTEKEELVSEICDFMYHLSVMMAVKEITWDEVFQKLAERELKEGNLKKFHTKGEV